MSESSDQRIVPSRPLHVSWLFAVLGWIHQTCDVRCRALRISVEYWCVDGISAEPWNPDGEIAKLTLITKWKQLWDW